MNIECDQKTLDEVLGAFRFSDAVLRHLVIKRDEAVTDTSPLAKAPEDEDDESPRERRREAPKDKASSDAQDKSPAQVATGTDTDAAAEQTPAAE